MALLGASGAAHWRQQLRKKWRHSCIVLWREQHFAIALLLCWAHASRQLRERHDKAIHDAQLEAQRFATD
eukprot:5798534-Amphidinium_carterae.1